MDKKIDAKRIRGMIGTAVVLALLIAVALYAFLGRSKITRTHFQSVSTGFINSELDRHNDANNEFTDISGWLNADGAMVYDDDFKENYPNVSSALADRDFCSSEVDIRSARLENGLLIIDGYSYTADLSVRKLDMIFLEYRVSDDSEITLLAPKRLSISYDTALGMITRDEVEDENFRLNFYDLKITARAGDPKQDWNVGAEVKTDTDDNALLNQVSKNLTMTTDGKKADAQISVKGSSVELSAPGAAKEGKYELTLNFNDDMYRHFQSITFSDTDSAGNHSVTSFSITVNSTSN